jgi:hypothetical protein
MSQTVPIPQHQLSPPLTRGITIHPPHQITIYNNPKTAAIIPAPAPNIGNAVAFAPESVTAPPAAEVAELAAPFALLVAAPTTAPPLLVTLSTAPLV